MPQRAWSNKRERQYDHIKDGLLERGSARTSPKRSQLARSTRSAPASGEARQRSRTSTEDISSSRRGGLRSHRGRGGRTKDQLYQEARDQGIEGRSKMTSASSKRQSGGGS